MDRVRREVCYDGLSQEGGLLIWTESGGRYVVMD